MARAVAWRPRRGSRIGCLLPAALACALGCAAGGTGHPPPAAPPLLHLRAAPLYVAPLADPAGCLDAHQLRAADAAVRAEIARWRAAAPLAPVPHRGVWVLRLEVRSWRPGGRPLAALLIGLGSGRPGYAAEAVLERAGSPPRRARLARTGSRLLAGAAQPEAALAEALAVQVRTWLAAGAPTGGAPR
ncbi:MAG: hypothetical protein KatS3mg102_0762 [Planctomycetota bacterium]|nr:MAG: hypothetical protein KatS3mg102_0762 [Planctomycetota bacterium]